MKNNLEENFQYWLSNDKNLKFAPPEILAILYGIYKSTLAKKKTGSALRAEDPKATRKASRSKTGEHNIKSSRSKLDNSDPV